MAITPVDLRNAQFEKKFRGLNPADVETLINAAAEEIERLLTLNNEQQRQILALEDKLRAFQNLEKSLKETLLTAQQAAEEKKKSAEKAAQLQIKETELACAEMKHAAQKDIETAKFELASLRMQKVRFAAELKALIDAHQKLLEEKSASENLVEVAAKVQELRAELREDR